MTAPNPHLHTPAAAPTPAVSLAVGRFAAAWCDLVDLPDGRVAATVGGWCQGLGEVGWGSREYPTRAAALGAFRQSIAEFLARGAPLEAAQEEARRTLLALVGTLDGSDTTLRALEDIRARLTAGTRPEELIPALVPASTAEARWWARRFALWAEYVKDVGPEAIGVARLVTQRAMRRFGLALGDDGRVAAGNPALSDTPTATFRLGEVRVDYIRERCRGQDHYQFTAEGDAPIAFTGGRHYPHFTPTDAVAALGGPAAYLERYVAALTAGRQDEFLTAFAETRPDPPRRAKRRPDRTDKPAEAASVRSAPPPVPPPAAPEKAASDPPVKTQGTLF